MDPKNSSTLDPKLKETYERIMGTPVAPAAAPAGSPAPSASPATPATTDQSVPQINVTPAPSTAPAEPEPFTPIISPAPTASPAPAQIQPADEPTTPATQPEQHTVLQQTTPLATAVTKPGGVVIGGKSQGSSGILPIVSGVGALIFLVVYTIFWIKFFNFPLPFALPF